MIFFAYIGFDAVSTAAQETKNPQRDMPIGILGSLAICTVLYIAVALVLTGIVNYTKLNVPDPIAVGINAAGPGLAWLRPVVKIGAIAGLSSVILVMLLGQPRIFYTMSKDGLLPPVFSAVHPKFRTPWLASHRHRRGGDGVRRPPPDRPAGRAGLHRHAARLRHRLRRRAGAPLHRSRTALGRSGRRSCRSCRSLGILSCVYLMLGLPVDTWARLIVWMAIGLAIYFLYGRRHSKSAR